MDILDGRNWKYVIAFDNTIYRDVMHHSFLYEKNERNILNFQIDFYRNHFTFQQLIKSFRVLDTEEEIKEFKDAVYKRRHKILFCPKELKQFYLEWIEKYCPDHAEFLHEMLKLATEKKCKKNPLLPVYKRIFGVYYNPIKAKLKRYTKKEFPAYCPNPISGESKIREVVKKAMKGVANDKIAQGIWGEYGMDSVRLDFNNDVGFGKFISKQFFSGAEDCFIIQTNERKITKDEVEYGAYRNIYPGRGHFMNTIIPNRNYNFDSGADYIVNGWSTFSAWHMYPSSYATYSKALNCRVMYKMLTGDWQKSLTDIYIFLLGHVAKETAINYMIEITQYPGRFESYVMGGIGTEMLIDKHFATNPLGLLDEYKRRNLADLFALFKPNTNKC